MLAETADVVTTNDLAVPPEPTVVDVGTLATVGLSLESVTIAPPDGAALRRCTVPVGLVLPPFTVEGETAT